MLINPNILIFDDSNSAILRSISFHFLGLAKGISPSKISSNANAVKKSVPFIMTRPCLLTGIKHKSGQDPDLLVIRTEDYYFFLSPLASFIN